MEKLQMSETSDSDYPNYFKVFLDNCIRKYGNTFLAGDYLFAAVYFIILDSGFSSLDLYEKCPLFCTESFNIRKLRQVLNYKDDYVKLHDLSNNMGMAYKIPVRLGGFRCSCEIQCVPCTENENFMIVNLLKKEKKFVKSVCINIDHYTKRNSDPSDHKFAIQHLRELETAIKDELCNPLRGSIFLNETRGACAHLLRLPEHLQNKIMKSMSTAPSNILHTTTTCSYFYHLLDDDGSLWQEMCGNSFRRRTVLSAVTQLFEFGINQANVHRQVFFKLKKRDYLKRKFRPYGRP